MMYLTLGEATYITIPIIEQLGYCSVIYGNIYVAYIGYRVDVWSGQTPALGFPNASTDYRHDN